jgi:hypothetical protein
MSIAVHAIPMLSYPRFTEADAQAAFDEWGANCGPGALAAITRISLEDVRSHMGDFESKGYTNPMLMCAALDSLGVKWWRVRRDWPRYGLVRVQWEGPWTAAGVPQRARYRYTHWIGTAEVNGDRGIFDINCMNNGTGWVSERDWADTIAPFLAGQYKRASGGWHVTHGIEVRP